MAYETGAQSKPAAVPPFAGSLLRRSAITLGGLLIYHFASFIPLPHIDANAAADFFANDGAHLPFQRLSGFMLGTIPMFSALILAEFIMLFSTTMRNWQLDPKSNFHRGVLAIALLLSAFQAWGMAKGLEGINSGLVIEPGGAFRISTAVSFMAATGLIAWLASIITKHGLGSGFWLLFLTPALANAPTHAGNLVSAVTTGAIAPAGFLILIVFVILAAFALVALERANPGLAASEGLIWPPLLAGVAAAWLLAPMVLFVSAENIIDSAVQTTAPGHLLRLIALAVLVPALTLWRIQSLKESGSAVPISSPVTIAFVLTAILIAAELAIARLGLPNMQDGPTLIILVSVALSVLASARNAKPKAL